METSPPTLPHLAAQVLGPPAPRPRPQMSEARRRGWADPRRLSSCRRPRFPGDLGSPAPALVLQLSLPTRPDKSLPKLEGPGPRRPLDSHPKPPGSLRGSRGLRSPLPEAAPGVRPIEVKGRGRGRGRGAPWLPEWPGGVEGESLPPGWGALAHPAVVANGLAS